MRTLLPLLCIVGAIALCRVWAGTPALPIGGVSLGAGALLLLWPYLLSLFRGCKRNRAKGRAGRKAPSALGAFLSGRAPLALLFLGAGFISCALFLREEPGNHPRFDSYVSSLPEGTALGVAVDAVESGEFGERIRGRFRGHSASSANNANSGRGWAYADQPLWLRTPTAGFREGDLLWIKASEIGKGRVPLAAIENAGQEADWRSRFRELKGKWCFFIDRCPLQERTRGFLQAMFCGERSGLPAQTRRAFADSGLAHILALSGMHVGILGVVAMLLFRPLDMAGRWKLRKMGVVGAVWFFALVSGLSASTVRAALMLTASSVASVGQRRLRRGENLLAAASAILCLDPEALFEPGFQLSFLCVGCLLAFAGPLNRLDRRLHPRLHGLVSWLLVPIIATGGTWAVGAWHFGQLPLGFLPMNLVAVPLLPLYVLAGLCYLLLRMAVGSGTWFEDAAEGCSGLLGRCLDDSLELLHQASAWIAGNGETVLPLQPPAWLVWGWLALLALLAWRLNRNPKRN